jgi:hypothetical protein
VIWEQNCRLHGAVRTSGSLSMAQFQTEPPLRDNSIPHQSPSRREPANPLKEPSMLASFTSKDSESQIGRAGNPLPIHLGRKLL